MGSSLLWKPRANRLSVYAMWTGPAGAFLLQEHTESETVQRRGRTPVTR